MLRNLMNFLSGFLVFFGILLVPSVDIIEPVWLRMLAKIGVGISILFGLDLRYYKVWRR